MTVSQQTRDQAERLRRARQRRLDELEVKAATFGVDVPVEIAIEIEDLQAQLAIVGPLATAPVLDPQIIALLKRYDQLDTISIFLGDYGKRLLALENGFEKLKSDVAAWFLKRDDSVIEDQRLREIRQRRWDLVMGALLAISLLNAAAIAVLVIRALQ